VSYDLRYATFRRRQDCRWRKLAVQAWKTRFPTLQGADAKAHFNFIFHAVKVVLINFDKFIFLR
jgi:hypothetical protein